MATVNPTIEESWKNQLRSEFESDYFLRLKEFLLSERDAGQQVFPKGKDIFAAFNHTPFSEVKVVILGQDPYHGPGQAHGLSFSVPEGIPLPPSLLNIYKELNREFGWPVCRNGNLEKWARQGVLLLNATLTVRSGEAGSHQKKGWEEFTDAVIRKLSEDKSGLVFLLWGRFAQAKENLIDASRHHILKAAHPSPFSADRGFFGCNHFIQTNELLRNVGKTPIDWRVDV
ncbi:MAG: uracil-DNA glycosylase [Bacteroidota bacterium]